LFTSTIFKKNNGIGDFFSAKTKNLADLLLLIGKRANEKGNGFAQTNHFTKN